jgi:hypothetical protein
MDFISAPAYYTLLDPTYARAHACIRILLLRVPGRKLPLHAWLMAACDHVSRGGKQMATMRPSRGPAELRSSKSFL